MKALYYKIIVETRLTGQLDKPISPAQSRSDPAMIQPSILLSQVCLSFFLTFSSFSSNPLALFISLSLSIFLSVSLCHHMFLYPPHLLTLYPSLPLFISLSPLQLPLFLLFSFSLSPFEPMRLRVSKISF